MFVQFELVHSHMDQRERILLKTNARRCNQPKTHSLHQSISESFYLFLSAYVATYTHTQRDCVCLIELRLKFNDSLQLARARVISQWAKLKLNPRTIFSLVVALRQAMRRTTTTTTRQVRKFRYVSVRPNFFLSLYQSVHNTHVTQCPARVFSIMRLHISKPHARARSHYLLSINVCVCVCKRVKSFCHATSGQ